MLPHALTSFQIQKYCQVNLNLMVFIKDIYLKQSMVVFVKNLDEYKLIETHWLAFYVNGYNGRAS